MKIIELTMVEFGILFRSIEPNQRFSNEELLNKGIQNLEVIDEKWEVILRFIVKDF